MISDVSHQLKTPLAALRMYDEIMAQEGTDRETILAFSQKSLREIRRVEDVVYTLLKIARLDAGTVRMEKAEENMEMLLKDVTERFETLAAREAKEIVLSGSGDVSLYCDALWMSEALGNVVKNALEHTGRGGKVVISWERTPLLTNIVVEDNGTGIRQEDIHNIFKTVLPEPHFPGYPWNRSGAAAGKIHCGSPSGDDFRNQQGRQGQQVCLKLFPSYKRVR